MVLLLYSTTSSVNIGNIMSETREIVSVITCDLEGRIETFNRNAEKLFGYSADEVIGKKRVSLFSPGMVVLGHVANWLDKAKENKDGYSTETTFVRKSGEQFAASFKITATVIKGKHVGYCGRTREIERCFSGRYHARNLSFD